MFESLFLNEDEKLLLVTNKGRQIDNYVEVHPPPAHASQAYSALLKLCGHNWIERKPATGRYNCAGLVWASRILEVSEYDKIINDDGYRDLELGEIVAPGDVAVYFDKDNNDEILHVGRVFGFRQGIAPGSSPIARVLSTGQDRRQS